MPLHFSINQHNFFLTRFLSPRIRHLSPLTCPPPLSPTPAFSQYLKIAHLFLIHGPVSHSRQQFSQNHSCIKPEDTILWHCKMIYLSVILVILTIIIRQLRTHLHLHYSISGTPRSEAQDVSHHRNE